MAKSKEQNERITIKGELTIYTVAELKESLLAKLLTNDELVLDLSAVDEFDAAGLQLLIVIKRGAMALGRVFKITQHSPAVLNLLNLAGLTSLLGDSMLITPEIILEENLA